MRQPRIARIWVVHAGAEPMMTCKGLTFMTGDRSGRLKFQPYLIGLSQQGKGVAYVAVVGAGDRDHFDARCESPEMPRELCLLYTSPSPRDRTRSRMPSSA